nr:hypothetical protein [Tanacetum cinerariifolium]
MLLSISHPCSKTYQKTYVQPHDLATDSLADKSAEVGKQDNEALGNDPHTSSLNVVNEVDKIDVGSGNIDANNVTMIGPAISTSSPGISNLYANVTGKLSRKSVNFRTLFTPSGNGVDVVVTVESIRVISKRFANTACGFFLGKRVAYHVVANYVRNIWGKYGVVRSCLARLPAMIELRADVELKDNIVVAMPKIIGEGFYTCNICVEYEWKPPRYTCCKVFGHVQEECPKNIDSEDEVALVDNEMASFLAKKDGYGTQSLLEQWKKSYENDDYEYDPYDDDMYEGQKIPDKLQAFCDNLDIKVRGRKKK